MLKELEQDNLDQLVQENAKVVVQYSAGWCGNCRIMKPKFKKMAGEHEDVTFLIVDAEKFPNARQLANVDNLPTFAAFSGGKLAKQVQTNKTEVLKSFIDEVTSN